MPRQIALLVLVLCILAACAPVTPAPTVSASPTLAEPTAEPAETLPASSTPTAVQPSPEPSYTPTPIPTTTEAPLLTATLYPLPASTTIYVEPTDYTPEQAQLIRDGIVAMYNYLRAIGLEEDPGPIAMYSFDDKQKLTDTLVPIYGYNSPIRNAQTGHSGGHLPGLGIRWTGQPFDWLAEARLTDVFWFENLNGLYFEVVLANLAGQNIDNPGWMLQGGWNYFSAQVS